MEPTTAAAVVPSSRERIRVSLIDVDLHLAPRSRAELLEYFPPAMRDRIGDGRRFAGRQAYLPLIGTGARMDAVGPNGEAPGTDPDTTKRQLLVDEGADFGIITPMPGNGPDPELNAATFHAMNGWQADTYLREDPIRLFGSICVTLDDVAAAVREIQEWSSHPGFKGILIPADSERPFGHPMYEPIWEAAAEAGLPLGVHFNESNRLSLGGSPVGHYLRYLDFHALTRVLDYGAHLVSWITNGVFARHPDFRVAFLEGGFLWHRPLISRLAYRWEDKRGNMPHATKPPLDCLRDQVRFASQPMESAPVSRDLAGMLRVADAERLLMFSSDYPHYDYDNPDLVLPPGISAEMTARIMCENAREYYDLPADREPDAWDEETAA